MENRQHRFFCHIQSDGTWGVWDRVANKPARLGGGDIAGYKAQRAEVAQSVLTRIYGGGLDALTVRHEASNACLRDTQDGFYR